MKSDAVFKTTQAIKNRIQSAIRTEIPNATVFTGSLDEQEANSSTLILFLYRIVPNGELRNSERRLPSADGSRTELYKSALALNLHYLLSVGTGTGFSEESKLKALGISLQTIQSEPEFFGAEVDFEKMNLSLDSSTTDELGRIWALFPNTNCRTSVSYVASPIWIDPMDPDSPGNPVVSDELRSGVSSGESQKVST